MEGSNLTIVTCTAPTNLATVKYWGKDNIALNTPLNSSISVTLQQEHLHAKTTIAASSTFSKSRFWLNRKEEEITSRIATVIREMRALAMKQDKNIHNTDTQSSCERIYNQHIHIVSENTFPTAAGLASSAAGLACLVVTLAKLYQLNEEFPGQFSTFARKGSGSACRSLYGGFVKWNRGLHTNQENDEAKINASSIAAQIADEQYWPSLCAVICIVNDHKKETSSTSGMGTSKSTSKLLQYRAEQIVPQHVKAMEDAIIARDFQKFGMLTMQESNQFHAICVDTFPPIFYLNETSHAIINLVHKFNAINGNAIRAAYTFDAGPNAVIFTEAKDVRELVHILLKSFPLVQEGEKQMMEVKVAKPLDGNDSFIENIEHMNLSADIVISPRVNEVKMIYVSGVGSGPMELPLSKSLVDKTTGLPFQCEA